MTIVVAVQVVAVSACRHFVCRRSDLSPFCLLTCIPGTHTCMHCWHARWHARTLACTHAGTHARTYTTNSNPIRTNAYACYPSNAMPMPWPSASMHVNRRVVSKQTSITDIQRLQAPEKLVGRSVFITPMINGHGFTT